MSCSFHYGGLFIARQCAKVFVFIALFIQWPHSVQARVFARDGHLRLVGSHTGEYLEITYEDENGNVIPAAMKKITHLMRSRGDDSVGNLDVELIRLMDHLQDHFQADQIEVISGYRSPAFNKSLKETGHAVARESYHMKGQACDIHLDEINERDLAAYARSLKLGGVGYYGDRLFVHVDTGPVRSWDAGNFRNNTSIGIFNKASSWHIRTNNLFYGARDSLTVSQGQLIPEDVHVTIEKFWRGKWTSVGEISHKKVTHTGEGFVIGDMNDFLISGTIPYGKFRLHYQNAKDWQNSNEFYIKKYK